MIAAYLHMHLKSKDGADLLSFAVYRHSKKRVMFGRVRRSGGSGGISTADNGSEARP